MVLASLWLTYLSVIVSVSCIEMGQPLTEPNIPILTFLDGIFLSFTLYYELSTEKPRHDFKTEKTRLTYFLIIFVQFKIWLS